MKLLKRLWFALMVLVQLAILIPAFIVLVFVALIQMIVSDVDKKP